MKKALEMNTLNLPKANSLLSDADDTPYICVGYEAFPLASCMMKPYPQRYLSQEFLPRARRISENAYCILANRRKVLAKPFLLKPEQVKD